MSWADKSQYDPLNPGAATWNPITEHNRQPISVDFERIGESDRTVNGSLRKWFVADKRTFSTSWNELPHSSAFTVDGRWGGSEMEAFYLDPAKGRVDFWVQVREPNGATSVYRMVFKSFSRSVEKRGRYEFWSVSLSLEEV
jgi:hypothetical protein